MNRRELLRSMMGVAAATALPSEIWPFRKIFLPPLSMSPKLYSTIPTPGGWRVYFSPVNGLGNYQFLGYARDLTIHNTPDEAFHGVYKFEQELSHGQRGLTIIEPRQPFSRVHFK